MKRPKLSIIIPTLNEEAYLPRLLDSIKKQDFKDYEIIVADGYSKDRTRKIAKKYGCRLATMIMQLGVSVHRNAGAKISRGNVLLFLDADGILPDGFLSAAYSEFMKRNLDCAVPYLEPITNVFLYKLHFFLYNISSSIVPIYIGGNCIMIKKSLHMRLKGFDEKKWMFEDSDYVNRARKIGKFKMMSSLKLYLSPRRFEEEGYFKTSSKYIKAGFFVLIGKPLTRATTKFEFGKHTVKK